MNQLFRFCFRVAMLTPTARSTLVAPSSTFQRCSTCATHMHRAVPTGLRRPVPHHHAAAPPQRRCATCCRKRAPHHAASLAARSTLTSYPRNSAASRVQHCLQRHSLLIVSYNLNMTCAAGAPPRPPALGASPVFASHSAYTSTPQRSQTGSR